MMKMTWRLNLSTTKGATRLRKKRSALEARVQAGERAALEEQAKLKAAARQRRKQQYQQYKRYLTSVMAAHLEDDSSTHIAAIALQHLAAPNEPPLVDAASTPAGLDEGARPSVQHGALPLPLALPLPRRIAEAADRHKWPRPLQEIVRLLEARGQTQSLTSRSAGNLLAQVLPDVQHGILCLGCGCGEELAAAAAAVAKAPQQQELRPLRFTGMEKLRTAVVVTLLLLCHHGAKAANNATSNRLHNYGIESIGTHGDRNGTPRRRLAPLAPSRTLVRVACRCEHRRLPRCRRRGPAATRRWRTL